MRNANTECLIVRGLHNDIPTPECGHHAGTVRAVSVRIYSCKYRPGTILQSISRQCAIKPARLVGVANHLTNVFPI